MRDTYQVPYTLTEIEMILNYFPHSIWNEQDSSNSFGMDDSGNIPGTKGVSSLQKKFYAPVIDQLE